MSQFSQGHKQRHQMLSVNKKDGNCLLGPDTVHQYKSEKSEHKNEGWINI